MDLTIECCSLSNILNVDNLAIDCKGRFECSTRRMLCVVGRKRQDAHHARRNVQSDVGRLILGASARAVLQFTGHKARSDVERKAVRNVWAREDDEHSSHIWREP